MFGFLDDFSDYESRKVDRYEEGGIMVSTARVSDGELPYETGVFDSRYHDSVFIVEAYGSKDDAQQGHGKWVKLLTGNEPPDTIIECRNSRISQLKEAEVYERKGDNDGN